MDTIADLMTPNPVRVTTAASVERCAGLMHHHGVRHLPVLDSDGGVVGLLYDYAVERHAAARGAHSLVAGEVAVPVDVVAHEWDDLVRTLKRMRLSEQDAAIVIDGEAGLSGIVTEHDVVRLAQDVLPESMLAMRKPGKSVWAVRAEEPAIAALRMMRRHRIRHVLVARGDHLSGVLSYRDLGKHGITAGVHRYVRELVSEAPICVATEGTPIPEVARLMAVWKVGCVPILDFAERPVGIVTRADLVQMVVDAMRRPSARAYAHAHA